MELQAAIEALAALGETCEVEFHTDSQYVKNGVSSWIQGWKRNGWQTQAKEPVKNEDLWRSLDAQAARHQVRWCWVKGHAGHPGNERCDQLARNEIARIKRTYSREQLKGKLKEMRTEEPKLTQGRLFF